MAFLYAQIYAGTISATTGSIPQGVITFFITNTGSAAVTLTFTSGNTFSLAAGESFEGTFIGKPYDTISIDASSSSVKYAYTKS